MDRLIFETSHKGAKSGAQTVPKVDIDLPESLLREDRPCLPEVSELEAVRHFTKLSQKNYSIDSQFYPLGSCTMKYNPRGVQSLASHPKMRQVHPLMPAQFSQGYLKCLYDLQEDLKEITGMKGVSLTPMAGAQGEFAGVAMIKQYHHSKGDLQRMQMLVPDSAHGTNPASAVMCGFSVKEVPTDQNGDLDLKALESALDSNTAGIMLTNPSTLGLFERQITKVAAMVHEAGGLLYYDGANLNAILGRVRPGDMGFDVMHMNMHKTFATPHGGGGPGSGPVAANTRLLPFLPVPIVGKDNAKDEYIWLTDKELPQSIGRMSCFMGNSAILFRAFLYIRMLGREGLRRVSSYATLNANYLMQSLKKSGLPLAYPERLASHEFVMTFQQIAKEYDVTARDIAKRLLDYDMHAPTTYFPLGVSECFLVEPTETESKRSCDEFISVLIKILDEVKSNPNKVKTAPHTTPVGRLDDVKAARQLNLIWKSDKEKEKDFACLT